MTEPSREQLLEQAERGAHAIRTWERRLPSQQPDIWDMRAAKEICIRLRELLDYLDLLEKRIHKALECLDGLDELGAVLAAQTPNYPSPTWVSSTTIRALLTGAALDGEDEEQR